MATIKRIIRGMALIFVFFVVIGAFGKKINVLLSANHVYSEWWFYLLIAIGIVIAYRWVMKGSSGKGRDYGREYNDCNKAWQLIHKNGWTADDFSQAHQLLSDGHLRYTNNGDYIKELNKKLMQESLKAH